MKLTERLQSRKFLVCVGSLVFFAMNKQFSSMAQVVVAYLAVTAAQDALSDWQENRSTELPSD